MGIKKRNLISKQDLEDALDFLGISISEISKATGVPRSYIGDLKNRGVPLRRESAQKLLDYLVGQGVEFDHATSHGAPPVQDNSSHQRTVGTVGEIDDAFSDDIVLRVRARLEDNEAQILALLKKRIERGGIANLIDNEKIDEESQAYAAEATRLLAENYFLARSLRGWPAFEVPAADQTETLRELLLDTFSAALAETGLRVPASRDGDSKARGGANGGSSKNASGQPSIEA